MFVKKQSILLKKSIFFILVTISLILSFTMSQTPQTPQTPQNQQLNQDDTENGFGLLDQVPGAIRLHPLRPTQRPIQPVIYTELPARPKNSLPEEGEQTRAEAEELKYMESQQAKLREKWAGTPARPYQQDPNFPSE
jgi:hypothetical protein